MSSFLNLDLDKNIKFNLLSKHIIFGLFWIIGISIIIFRMDTYLLDFYKGNLKWIGKNIMLMYFISLTIYFFYTKWYYFVALLFYPILLVFWFIPKTVLSIGKIYLLGNYIESIYSKLSNLKVFAFNFFFFLISLIILFSNQEVWARWIFICCISYFYLVFVFRFIKKSFKQPTIFGHNLESTFEVLNDSRKSNNSVIINSLVIQKDDSKLSIELRRTKQIKRAIMTKYASELFASKLNSYQGRQAYIVSWVYGAFVFLVYSLIFFSLLNFQLHFIDSNNFEYTGTHPQFDFFYYTLKTITFGEIEIIKPMSIIARISEIFSFLIIGVFIMVIVVSIFLSMNQEKVQENIKLTTELIKNENISLIEFLKTEYNVEIESALSEIKNIEYSLQNLKKNIDSIF
jgi:hypothetical protein